MDALYTAAIGAAAVGIYVLGILTHKYVVSEAESIKQHVTGATEHVRADLAERLAAAAKKI